MCAGLTSWLIHMCDMTYLCVTWQYVGAITDMTHPYVWHDSFICVTWLTHMCAMTHTYRDTRILSPLVDLALKNDVFLFICVTWLIHICDMTHSYVCVFFRMWPDLLIIHVRHRLIHMCDTTHSYECVCALKNVTWLTHCSCVSQTHSHVWHDSLIWVCVCP